MVIEVGKLAGNAIVPYSQTTRRTKKYDITVTEGTSNNYVDVDSWAIAYADSNDNWFLHFHIHGTKDNNTTSTTLAITGVTFASESETPLTVLKSSVGYASKNTSNVISGTLSSASSTLYIDGLVALESEPTWAAANMESSVDASIHVQSASASKAGLMDTAAQSFAGVKTFTNAVSIPSVATTVEPTSFYETGTWDPELAGELNCQGAASPPALLDSDITWGAATYTRIGNKVFASIGLTTGISITTAGSRTYISVSTTGLPGMTTTTVINGSSNIIIDNGSYEPLPSYTGKQGGANTYVLIAINTSTNLGASNGDGLDILISFWYEI